MKEQAASSLWILCVESRVRGDSSSPNEVLRATNLIGHSARVFCLCVWQHPFVMEGA